MNYTEKNYNRIHFPPWLRKPIPRQGKKSVVEAYIQNHSLHTVCSEAKCPNRTECFARGTATFLIMGGTCTRNCLFCSVNNGIPSSLDSEEPKKIGDIVQKMRLKYVVITSVTRDDLTDGGASHFSKTVLCLKRNIPGIQVEILTPDFNGSTDAIDTVIKSKPDVFNHNIETVASIFPHIRPEADFQRSLDILRYVGNSSYSKPVKSGFMVGLGESEEEVQFLLKELKEAKVTSITIGQYLQPSKWQVPVKEFITPEQFEMYKKRALAMGFERVVSGSFVRSSYMADHTVI